MGKPTSKTQYSTCLEKEPGGAPKEGTLRKQQADEAQNSLEGDSSVCPPIPPIPEIVRLCAQQALHGRSLFTKLVIAHPKQPTETFTY
jgi:hypothetical protein